MNISKLICDGKFSPEMLRFCFHHGKSGQQKVAEQQTASDVAQSNDATKAAQGTFSQFEGPVQQSPFYKALLTTGIEDTSNAYQNAKANTTARARAAGFGYEQPVTQGAQSQMDQAEASALARVPQNATIAATQPALTAAEGSAGLGLGLGNQAQGWNKSAYDMNRQRGSWWDTLMKVGQGVAGIAGSFVNPAGGFGKLGGGGGGGGSAADYNATAWGG